MEDAKSYTERFTIERIVKAQSGHVPVPISIVEKPGAEPAEIADGAALWTKPKAEITPADYTDFYRSIAGQFDEPALTVHFRAEGRQDYTALAFVPGSRPFDLFDPDRKGRIKLYVKRVFITDDAEILPRYLRFVRGLVDSADLPLNVSREMIQESPILAAIRKGVTSRVLGELEQLADKRAGDLRQDLGRVRRRAQGGPLRGFRAPRRAARARALQDHGVGEALAQPEGLCRARSRRTRPRSTTSPATTSTRLEASPHLEGFRARGIEVLLLSDPVDSFWVMSAPVVRRQAVQVGDAGRGRSRVDPAASTPRTSRRRSCRMRSRQFLAFVKTTLGDDGRGRARVGPADRQRGLPGRARVRPRPRSWKRCSPAPGG